MPLYRIQDFNPNYREEAFENIDFKGIDVYSPSSNEKIGSIDDVLVDETGHFRYFVVNTDFWIPGKKITLPVARAHIDPESDRFYAVGIDRKEQLEKMPHYNDSRGIDYDYEEQIRSIYRTTTVENSAAVEDSLPVEMWATVEDSPPVEAIGVEGIESISTSQAARSRPSSTPSVQPPVVTPPQPSPSQPTTSNREIHSYERERTERPPIVEDSLPIETSATVENSAPLDTEAISKPTRPVEPPVSSTSSVQAPVPIPPQPSPSQPTTPKRDYSFDYERDPDLYRMNKQNHHKFKLYEERLVASKSRHKTGDVSIGKRVETSTAHASVPVEKEKVVIERNTPEDAGKVVNPNEVDFDKDKNEVARMEVYEETADIDKQTVVKEEVEVRKEVVRDTVEASGEVRREELEVDTEGKFNREKR